MRYVQRDANGKVVGHFANPQIGYAEEAVQDDHRDIVEWDEARKAAPVVRLADLAAEVGRLTQLLRDAGIE